ncbi:hypothetical protein CsSME_00001236 [Camellia sinensis var. sinensis]
MNGGEGIRATWVPTKSVEPKLDKATEDRVKRMREWREEKGVRWDELVLPSKLFALDLGPQPLEEDPAREELEAQMKVREEKERRLFARADKYRETQLGPAPKLIARERIRPRPKPLGEKDLGNFEPRLPPVDPVKERANKKGEALKKKKKKMSVHEGAADAPGSKKARVGGEDTPMAEEAGEKGVRVTPEMVVVLEVQGDKGQGDQEGETHKSAMPKMQVESGSADPEEVME